ncbi:hypothetical protein PUNSTDRAFT_137507 [Punctularia strigosozonata HHB-11173 SS5]|uniref:uncharacterized protein n=1 Tax=Punctularia strigosozonata (strain HHB-11173) TaxID=741275 RepID=UPI000441693B|nr:uncharacterized protein PUNSTDRAFT_137507 [Punctularia strigosozonata HHB-11173 SS5]EIN05393.1 hypothetical protein PUNSTDRAFT_137507 [Punctularia strigosozonata HHB-11173 SS5]
MNTTPSGNTTNAINTSGAPATTGATAGAGLGQKVKGAFQTVHGVGEKIRGNALDAADSATGDRDVHGTGMRNAAVDQKGSMETNVGVANMRGAGSTI